MTEKPIEFLIVDSIKGEYVTLIGRCGDEQIALGDEFNAIYREKPRRYPDELGDPPVRVEEHSVSLRVVEIHTYGRSLEIPGQGSTGSIVIDGDDTAFLVDGWIVGRRLPVPVAQTD